MSLSARVLLVASLCFLLGPASLLAQQIDQPNKAYDAERSLIETTLQTVVAVLQEATFQDTGHSIGERLRHMASQLNGARQAFQPPSAGGTPPAPVTQEDLQRLEATLRDLYDQLLALRQELEAGQNVALANRLKPIERGLYGAVETVQSLAADERNEHVALEDGQRWLEPGRYDDEGYEPLRGRRTRRTDDRRTDTGGGVDEAMEDAREGVAEGLDGAREGIREGLEGAREGVDEARESVRDVFGRRSDEEREDDGNDEWDDDWDWDEDEWDDDRDRNRRYAFGRRGYSITLNDLTHAWPFSETALYRPIPALRYNRVEGVVLGVGLPPLRWDDYDRSHVYGQAGYAFALDRWRYEVGAETQLVRRYDRDFNLKLGANYHYNTATNDTWKATWLENSLAAFFFQNDFFDYYEVQGWTVYAVQQLTPYTQLSAGYRSDEYGSLDKNTTWSLFGGDGFRPNLPVEEGMMRSVVVAFEGGTVRGMEYLPRGFAFRTEAEFGDGLGGDFAFSRYLGDLRAYLPVNRHSALSLRLRGGLAEGGEVPFQKLFTIGGVGSVRAYPQNAFAGTRVLLGNVEYAVEDVSLFDDIVDDLQLFGFADAGWVNDAGTDVFRTDDALAAAGFGVGLDERRVRLELAWPLRDVGQGLGPSLWLRLNPTF